MLRAGSVAAPKRNLADLVETLFVFDKNWGILDENLAPAGLAAWPAWPALPPNIIPNQYPQPKFKPNITISIQS